MDNTELWDSNEQIEEDVDRIFVESDAIIFEILRNIARIAMSNL